MLMKLLFLLETCGDVRQESSLALLDILSASATHGSVMATLIALKIAMKGHVVSLDKFIPISYVGMYLSIVPTR